MSCWSVLGCWYACLSQPQLLARMRKSGRRYGCSPAHKKQYFQPSDARHLFCVMVIRCFQQTSSDNAIIPSSSKSQFTGADLLSAIYRQ